MRGRCSTRIAATGLIGWMVAACGGGGGGGDDGSGTDPNPDGGLTLPGGDTPPTNRFPLGVSSDGRYLVDHSGAPFLLHGEAAWSLIAQLNDSDTMQYLVDRRTRGVDAVLVNLIEHKFADQPPANVAGDEPFTTPGDFSTPNDAYFAHVDRVLDAAEAQGIAVLLTPAYLGFQGGDEGWFQEMEQLTPAQCTAYGDYLRARYASRDNVIWVWGGDYLPPSGSAGEACTEAISASLRVAGDTALDSAHWAQESTSRAESALASSVDLVGVYTYNPALALCRTATASSPRSPSYLIETSYEAQTYQGSSPAVPRDVRAQQWSALLGCGAGEISGNRPIWLFGDGWQRALSSPLSSSQVRLTTIAHSVAWQDLALDDPLVTSGRGSGTSEVVAARTSDGHQALIYLPPSAARTVTLDLSRMAGAVTATWQDPSAVQSQPAGDGLTGSHSFTAPGNNASGDGDWVLVLSAP